VPGASSKPEEDCRQRESKKLSDSEGGRLRGMSVSTSTGAFKRLDRACVISICAFHLKVINEQYEPYFSNALYGHPYQ